MMQEDLEKVPTVVRACLCQLVENHDEDHWLVPVGEFFVSLVRTHRCKIAACRLLVERRKYWKSIQRDYDRKCLENMLIFFLNGKPEPRTDDDDWFFLLWKIRVTCQQLQVQRHQRIDNSSEATAHWIATVARSIEAGLSSSTTVVTDKLIEPAGGWVCDQMGSANMKAADSMDPQTAVVVKAYSEAARRASGATREAAQGAIKRLRGVSREGISNFSRSLASEPSHTTYDSRKALAEGVANVGWATIGAATVVGEAVYNSTSRVAQSTAKATSTIISHRYGPTAGQVAEDTADTIGNLVRTAACYSTLTGRVMTKLAAKDTGKALLLSKYAEGV